jgi:hypothetical protein
LAGVRERRIISVQSKYLEGVELASPRFPGSAGEPWVNLHRRKLCENVIVELGFGYDDQTVCRRRGLYGTLSEFDRLMADPTQGIPTSSENPGLASETPSA